jgi:Peptidase M50B-like
MTGDGSDKNKPKPFKQGQPQDKAQPKLTEAASVEAKLAKLEAEINARAELTPPPVHQNLPEPVAPPKAQSKKEVPPTKEKVGHSPHINMAAFWAIAILSILLANAPGVSLLMTPVNQFVIMIHECSHAIVALLTGGHPAVTIVPDGLGHGGITQTNGGWLFFSAQAGYLGTAVFGCLLIWLGQFPKYSRYILMGIGCLMILSSVIFITPAIFSAAFLSGIFSMMWGLVMGVACIYMGKKLSPIMANLVLLFLAVQTALNSVTLAWVLVPHALGMAGSGFSDATIMQTYFFLPAIMWAMWWILLSLVMLFFTLKFTYGKSILNRKKIKKNI